MAMLLVVICTALVFEYINGFHDSANAIATVVSTKVLSARTAVIYAGCLDITGALLGTHVASTIGQGIVDAGSLTVVAVAAQDNDSISNCSKAPWGLSVLSRVTCIFTGTKISPSLSLRQCPNHYAFRAGWNLPDKEFRYLRTVIVTAAVYWGFNSYLRVTSKHSS